MNKKTRMLLLCCIWLALPATFAQKSIMRLTQPTLMNEVRTTPSPADGQCIRMNPPHFMWPDKYPHLGAVLDGVESHDYKPAVTYRIRIASDEKFTRNVITAERNWAFFNPFKVFPKGTYYWQHAYVAPDGTEEWSPVYHFTVDEKALVHNPPSLETVLANFPKAHPRILLDGSEWSAIRERNRSNPEALSYIGKAEKCFSKPLKHLAEEIDTTQVVKLTNIVQYRSALIREGRKIVDREEANIEALVRAYLLTLNTRYSQEAMKRLSEIISWKDSKYFAGDFNLSTILSMSTSVYDGCYDALTPANRQLLLETIRENGAKFYGEYVNHLENRIADNHVWQMTYRILTMAAFATYGEIAEAATWVDYCYNEWVSRLPGLNTDGSWHNGDSYFQVNYRTLIEVPAFYSRISGFDFFSDPWYNNNALYVVYHQPPFSHAGGHGNSHENKHTPTGARVGYADALARQCGNPWAAAYVRYILERDPDILNSAFEAKPADLRWYRCITPKAFPSEVRSLDELPSCKVFNENGVATLHTHLGDPAHNAMFSFRSSPYGSTSHALANQNAFNTFYGGKPIFYSSGHRTGFTDDHCMYAYRNTRAHNSILVNGMGQAIGTEGYGWIPRFYEGRKISYFAGDASNAYDTIRSPLWLERARLSGTQFTPENGWDVNRLNLFRRHVVQLGKTGLIMLYDELEGKEPVTWSYLLHTTEQPMQLETNPDGSVCIKGYNSAKGTSVAHLYSSEKLITAMTDTFFTAPVNWKAATDKKGKKIRYKNHWHFTATTPQAPVARFLTILDTHGEERADLPVVRKGDTFQIGEWTIRCNLRPDDTASFLVENTKEKVSVSYDAGKKDGKTLITDRIDGKKVSKQLSDYLPDFEI